MIRARENNVALRAGALSVLVHGLLLALFLFSVNWKSKPPMSVAEVELWDALPSTPPVKLPVPQPPEPVKPEPPKPEPKPDPAPEPEPKAEIQIKQEKPKPEVKKPPEKPIEKPKELPKPDPTIKAKELEKQKQEALKKLQQDLLAEDSKEQHANQKQEGTPGVQTTQVSQGEIDKYVSQIQASIRQKVNAGLCSKGNPELQFSISLILTGEIVGKPKLTKTSGDSICDGAVERAILLAEPLPVPKDPALFSQFRDLKLKFRPNDGN